MSAALVCGHGAASKGVLAPMRPQSTTPEEWRPVLDYEDAYEVSTLGNIRRIGADKCLTPTVARQPGYPRIDLFAGGQRIPAYVHTLMLKTFIGPRLGRTANHKDGVKSNNRLENLEWVTQGENNAHAYRLGLRSHNIMPAVRASAALRNAKLTCGKGHPYDIKNTRITRRGARRCRKCDAAWMRQKRAKLRTSRRLVTDLTEKKES